MKNYLNKDPKYTETEVGAVAEKMRCGPALPFEQVAESKNKKWRLQHRRDGDMHGERGQPSEHYIPAPPPERGGGVDILRKQKCIEEFV